MTNPLALERKIRKLATVQNYGDEILMKLTLTSHRVVVGSKGLLRVYAIRMAGWVNRTWVGRIGSAYLPMATLNTISSPIPLSWSNTWIVIVFSTHTKGSDG